MADVREFVKSIEVDSTIDNLTRVEAFVDEVCLEMDVRDESYGNVLIAVTEAFNNAVQHGNGGDASLKVKVKAFNEDEFIKLSIKDAGAGFDYNNLPDPTAPENLEKENGRGVFLMKSLADDVAFEENGALVTLSFKL
ncbi:serine/threonine-protein kinase RsbW [Lishizhenia tianjinensis]|uniref:Serine/threonine-protein kinase RsbW n=1 Tax=Lishizhenia tianjinensis TaxID=477690 RepID=A0A1I7BB48_9FLAO|nr:ATP-binding protein [Lishizhenia tianjinensis]SFT84426.1 serine/threonine-protein kinase RsbW [Lishizhenia tianjinensis]